MPFPDNSFDVILLHEVIEHVSDDAATLQEACRVVRPGGKIVIYAPNRLYPFETHGIYLGKRYISGNIPLVNYLPGFLRRRLAPHVRVYSTGSLRSLTQELDASWVAHTVVYPGFDKIAARSGLLAKTLRTILYRLENTWFRAFGLSHFPRPGEARGHRKGVRGWLVCSNATAGAPASATERTGTAASTRGWRCRSSCSESWSWAAAAATVAGFIIYRSYADDLVPIEEVLAQQSAGGAKIYDRNGRLLYEYMDDLAGLRQPVPLSDVSQYLIDATVATEDSSFLLQSRREHQGAPAGRL